MSAQSSPQQIFTIDEYLEREEKAEYKSEYYKGEVFAMAGGSPRHSRIGGNIYHALRKHLAGKPCRPYKSDMRVHIPIQRYFTYPDISVVCGKREFFEEKALMNPVLILEVLSESTKGYDRGAKFRLYSSIASLQEYTLVSPHERSVEIFRRNAHGRWGLYQFSGEENVELASIGCTLTMEGIYEDTV